MSLGRLLTSGKSLIGFQNEDGRYQMRRKNLLPKFGSDRNPFTASRPEPLRGDAHEKIRAVGRTLTPAEVAAAKLKETRPLPALTAVKDRKVDQPSAGESLGSRMAGWVKRIHPLGWLRRRATAPKPAVPRFDKAPVQAELSLDRIRVVRNDLSETDVEVVPAKISVDAKAEPVVRPVSRAETPELIKA